MNKSPVAGLSAAGIGNVLASAKFPLRPHFFHTVVLLMPLQPLGSSQAETAKWVHSDGSVMGTAEKYPSLDRTERILLRSSFSSQLGLQPHGQSFGIRQSSASVHVALSPPASCIACRHCYISCCSGCLFGRHAIWREVSGRWFVSRAGPRGGCMAGIRFTHVADNSGYFSV